MILSRFGEWSRHFISRLLTLIQSIILLRVVLKFFGASPSALVVRFIYKITDFIVSPFQSIFPNFSWGSHLVDVVAISAAIGYLVIFFIVTALIRSIFRTW